MTQSKQSQDYSKQVPIIIAIIIFLVIVAIALPKVASKENKNSQSKESDVEVNIVESDNLAPQNNAVEGNKDNSGAATVDEIMGEGSNTQDQGNIEEIIDDKEINF